MGEIGARSDASEGLEVADKALWTETDFKFVFVL